MNELSWFIYSIRNRFKIRTLHHTSNFYSYSLYSLYLFLKESSKKDTSFNID